MRDQIEALSGRTDGDYSAPDFELFDQFKAALNRGEIRAAERDADGKWHAQEWVKRGILLGFRMGSIVDESPADHSLLCFDKNTFPLRPMSATDGVRIVP